MADEQVTQETRVNSIETMMDANAELMEEIINDRRLSAMERMKGMSIGVRNQALLSRDQQQRIAMMVKLGMKPNGEGRSLSFQPHSDDA